LATTVFTWQLEPNKGTIRLTLSLSSVPSLTFKSIYMESILPVSNIPGHLIACYIDAIQLVDIWPCVIQRGVNGYILPDEFASVAMSF